MSSVRTVLSYSAFREEDPELEDEDLFVSPFKFVILSHCATSFGDMTNLRESLGLNGRFLDWGAFAVPSFHIIGIDVSSQH